METARTKLSDIRPGRSGGNRFGKFTLDTIKDWTDELREVNDIEHIVGPDESCRIESTARGYALDIKKGAAALNVQVKTVVWQVEGGHRYGVRRDPLQ
jgi:hypothetical protein